MRRTLFCTAIALTGCAATITPVQHIKDAVLSPSQEMEEEVQTGTGKVFVGKLSTGGAVNSRRSFVSDYHGEISLTIFPSRSIDCRFWVEGRITDASVYAGNNGFIEAFSTLCKARLQKDGTFEFQGAYLSDIPDAVVSDIYEENVGDEERTFTMKGEVQNDEIIGDLIIGGVFRNAIVLSDPKTIMDTGEGIRFTAAQLP